MTDSDDPKTCLLVREVAQRERVSPRTVVHWIERGALAAERRPGTRKWLIPVWAYWAFKHGG